MTASHNPPAYNGYKVYWENGAQIVPPRRRRDRVGDRRRRAPRRTIPCLPRGRGPGEGPLEGSWPRRRTTCSPLPGGDLALVSTRGRAATVGIVYTAMHGVGGLFALARPRASRLRGASTRSPEQQEPDGDFPTVALPEPRGAGRHGPGARARRARRGPTSSSPTIPTPTASRSVRATATADAHVLRATRSASCSAHYCPDAADARPKDPLVLDDDRLLAPARRRSRGRTARGYAETLTGFKWIANRALELERPRAHRFVFGYEEALGYTRGRRRARQGRHLGGPGLRRPRRLVPRARRDAVWGYLEEIQRAHGLFLSTQKNVTLPGGRARVRHRRRSWTGSARGPSERLGDFAVPSPRTTQAHAAPRGERPLVAAEVERPRLRARGRLAASRCGPRGPSRRSSTTSSCARRSRRASRWPQARARADQRLAALVADFVRLAVERGQPA